jgi:hypothetical protein
MWDGKLTRSVLGGLVILVLGTALASTASGATVRRVPARYATIQLAIDAASPGDEISVAPGRHCGALVDKPVTLDGHGQATIVGCATGPELFGGLRVGFLLSGTAVDRPASGVHVVGFRFDGRGVSAANLEPLAFGVLARFADDVHVSGNHFSGTVQAITNTGGDRWIIAHNDIDGLTLFDCTGDLCAGGDGIISQSARGAIAAPGGPGDPVNRAEDNLVFANEIEGTIPDGFDAFSMVGILIFAADGTVVRENRIKIPDNPSATAGGEGVQISNACCGDPTLVEPGSRNTLLLYNDGRDSEFVLVVEGTGGENTQQLVLFGNRGAQLVEGNVMADSGPPGRHRHADQASHHARRHLF